MSNGDRLTDGHRGTQRANSPPSRRAQSEEREWSEANRAGEISYSLGAGNLLVVLWNFDIGDARPKDEHVFFLTRHIPFQGALSRELDAGFVIHIVGFASESGAPNFPNQRLSEERAENVRSVLRSLVTGYQTDQLHAFGVGSQRRFRLEENAGRRAALNRYVMIRTRRCEHPLTMEQKWEAARPIIERRLGTSLIPYRDLWTPNNRLIRRMIPQPTSPFGSHLLYWGTHVPPTGRCSRRPGYHCISLFRPIDDIHTIHTLEEHLRSDLMICEKSEIMPIVIRFLRYAEIANQERKRLERAGKSYLIAGGVAPDFAAEFRRWERFYMNAMKTDPSCVLSYL